MTDTQDNYAQDEIEWHQPEIRAYFNDIFDNVYNPFLNMSDTLIQALLAFVNDDGHKGREADEAKSFVNEKQIQLVEDTIYCIQKLQSMMQGEGYETETPLLEDFISELSEDDTAVIKTAQLSKIITDFAAYNTSFKEIHPKVSEIHDAVESIAAGCDVITRKEFTKPDPSAANEALDAFVSSDGTEGFVPAFNDKFLAFHEKHSNDIEGSAFKTTLDTIVSNLNAIINGIGNGTFDIKEYSNTKSKLEWKDLKDALEGDDLDEYKQHLESFNAYLKGLIDRCQVYLYDPVNLNNGNYINDREDLSIAGRFPLSLRRFYNAQSDRTGYFGKGWTTVFDMHLTKEGTKDDSKIKLLFSDGHEGSYVRHFCKTSKTNENQNTSDKKYSFEGNEGIELVQRLDGSFAVKEDYDNEEKEYIEEHGEPGKLIEYRESYRLIKDDGTYTEFDKNGFVTSFGNSRCELARIEYKNGHPVKICSDLKYIKLNYGENGYVRNVEDNFGRILTYEYTQQPHKEDNLSPIYLLTQVTYPDETIRRYAYNSQGLINEVTNPVGTTFLKNEYDSKSRVVRQSFPDGGVITYAYDEENKITTATEQNGLKVEYLSDKYGRHIGTRYPAQGLKESYLYNDKNEKISVTNKRGYTTRFSYDNRGHLTKVIDAKGNITNITYNADGKPTTVKGPDGAAFKYSYNSYGELVSVINPLNETNRLYYNDKGQVERVVNPEGISTFLGYDDNGDICYIKDGNDVETFYERDELGRVISTSNAAGNTTKYEYDLMDRITKVTDAAGNITGYSYNNAGKLIKITNPDGSTKSWNYNSIGKTSEYTDECGRKTGIKYNTVWNEEEITLPNGGKISYEYDLLKRLIKVTDPENRETSYDYDEEGNVIARYNGDIKVQALKYDAVGNVISETDALGHTKKYDYDSNGNVIKVTDNQGNEYIRQYDKLGRVIAQTDPLGNTTSYTYTKLGDIDSVTDPAGRVRSFNYRNSQLKEIYFCDKLEQKLDYDRLGRAIKRSFADGYEISYEYDALNRITMVSGSDGRTVSYEYDAMGRAVKVKDGQSTTLYTYTPTGRLRSIVDALGNETAYTYDSLDNLKSIHRAEGRIIGGAAESSTEETAIDTANEHAKEDTFPQVGTDGHVTLFSYNLAGQLTKVTDALGQEETYEYDQYGRLKTKTDRDNYATNYKYNNLGAVTEVGYADGRSVAFSYNELNQLNEINDWLGKTTLENDILGRLTKVTDYQNRTVGYEYNSIGEKTKLTYPDGRVASYSYDEEGKLSAVVGNGEETSYSYDEFGRLVNKSFANGVMQEYSYLPGGNLHSMESHDKEGVLDKYFYTYDNTGLISGINRNRRGLDAVSSQYDYKYDAIGRLRESSLNGKTKSAYEYDAFGNRTSLVENETKTTYNYDVLDRLVEAKELNNSQAIVKTYDYDKRGNQTKEFVDGLLQKTFTFDATNMLAKVTDVTKGELENQYNGLGFRVASTRPEEKIEYLCDLSRDYYNLLERTVNGEKESFIYDNNIISMSKAGSNYYYLQDELGSPMYMTGTDGVAVSSYAFDDFGRNIDPRTGKIRKHEYTTNGNIIQPFAFTGYQEDEVSGLKFAQARFYSAENGRFVGEDQVRGLIIVPETINHFEYCKNNPLEYIDQNGKFLVSALVGAGIGAVIGGGATIASSLVKGEKIDWKEAGKNALKGAGAGALIGSGVGAVTAVASAVVGGGAAGAAIASSMSIGAAVCGTMSATMEAGLEIATNPDHNIHIGQIAVSGLGGAVSGLITGSGVGRLGAAGLNAINSMGVSVANDIQKGESAKKIAFDALVNGVFGGVAGLIGGSGANKGAYNASEFQYMLKQGGKYVVQEAQKVNVYGYLGNGAKYIKDALVKGLTISGLTTGIGSPIASAITSLYSDEEEQCHE